MVQMLCNKELEKLILLSQEKLMQQKPQNFSSLDCTFQNTEKECYTTPSYQKDK